MGSVDGWRRRQPGSTPPSANSLFQTKRGGSAMSVHHYDQQTPRRKPLVCFYYFFIYKIFYSNIKLINNQHLIWVDMICKMLLLL
jgi:hypothetical protein